MHTTGTSASGKSCAGKKEMECTGLGRGMAKTGIKCESTPPVDGPVRGPSISLKNACIPRPQQKATQEPAQSKSASSRGLGPHRAEVDRPARQNSDNTAGREECRDLPLNSTVRAKRCRMQKCMRSEPNAFCFLFHSQVLSQRRSLQFIL